MKKKFLIALTIILVLCISCTLFACNDSNPSADSREKAIENFQNAYLKACSDNWSLNLSAEEQKELYNEGHYVYQKELAAFYADVLKSSTIRTQKITAINEQLLYNEDLKKLIREGRLNYDKLLTLFSDTGLIAEDISELVYLTASKFINKGYDTASSILTKVTAIYEKAAQSAQTTANKLNELKQVKTDAEYLLESLEDIDENKSSLNIDLDLIKQPLGYIINFSYSTVETINALSEFNSEGEVTDSQADEIAVFISGAVLSVKELNSVFDEAMINSVGSALTNVSAVFENVFISGDSVINAVNNILNYVNFGLDYLPLACDIVASLETLVDSDFIKDVLNIKDYPEENYALVIGKAFSLLSEKFSSDSLTDRINKIKTSVGTNLEKLAVSSFILEGLFEASAYILPNDKSYYITSENESRIMSLVTYQFFKRSYMMKVNSFAVRYSANKDLSINTILSCVTWAKRVLRYLDDPVLNPNGVTLSVDITDYEDISQNPKPEFVMEWFGAIFEAADKMFLTVAHELNESVFSAARLMIPDFFAAQDTYDELADMYEQYGFISETDALFAELVRLSEESNIDKIINAIK